MAVQCHALDESRTSVYGRLQSAMILAEMNNQRSVAMSLSFFAWNGARRHVWGLALCCAPSFAAATAATTSIDLKPRWEVGASVDYLLTKTGVVRIGGVTKVNTTNTTPVHVEVASATSKGYVLTWTLGPTHFDDAASASMNPAMKKISGVMTGRQVILRLDRGGRLLEVTNWKAIREIGDATAGEIAALLAQSRMPREQAALAIAQFRSRFSSEEGVREVAGREVQVLLLLLGRRYDRSRPTEFATSVPNPVGEGQASVVERVELKSLDASAALEWTQRGAGTGVRDAQNASPSVKGRAAIDVVSGWPSLVTQTISATADDAERIETTSLQRQ